MKKGVFLYSVSKKKSFSLEKIKREESTMRTGELIRTLRKEKKLTQEQVADLLGVSA